MQLRLIELARAGGGGVLLLAPRMVLETIQHGNVDRKSALVARILGLRHLTQAALSRDALGRRVLALVPGGDALAGRADRDRQHRRVQ
ncbi:MAG: hypothetical protein M3Y77_08935 [Actinomycetota bacterium]|nr:hypothetical protein [Actinomycetota bacterium]